MTGWKSARINSNPRYIYGGNVYRGVVLTWKVNRWVVEWYVKGSVPHHIHREALPGTLTETEAQAMALAVWRMQ